MPDAWFDERNDSPSSINLRRHKISSGGLARSSASTWGYIFVRELNNGSKDDPGT